MKKRLIFGVLGALLALGAVAHRFFRNDESVVVAHSEPQRVVQPKLTKSQRIQKLYQAEADPIGVIPVSFEQIEYDTVAVAPKAQQSSVSLASTSTQAESAVAPKALMSSLVLPEPHVGHSGPGYADYNAQQPVCYDYDAGPQQEVQNPHASAQSSHGFSDAPQTQNVSGVEPQAPQSDDAKPNHYFNRSRHTNSYQPYEASPLVVKTPTKQQAVDGTQPGQEDTAPVAPKSLFGRMKNMVSKVPKWLYALGLAGLYLFLKSKKAVDLPAVAAEDAEKQDVDVAGQAHDKLQEKMDEHAQQHNQSPDANDPMGALPVKESVGQQEAPVAMDNIEPKVVAPSPVSGGLFGATKKLLSPARPIDATYLPEHVPVALVEHTSVAEQQPGMVRSAMHNAYQYFATRLQSTAGLLSLATKATALGLQAGTVVHGLHQARNEQLAEAGLDQAVMAVAQKCHVGMKQLAVANPVAQPIDGPSYAAQIGAGNVGAVAQQLAAKCAMLRLR